MKATLADPNQAPSLDSGPLLLRSAIPLPARLARVLLITAVVLAVTAAAVSGLVIEKPYAPVIVGGAVIALTAFIVTLKEPTWALFITVAIGLFPVGVLPDTIHSLLNRGSTVFALFIWLFNMMMWRRKIRFTPLTLLMIVFLAWSAFSTVWAQRTELSSSAMLTYIQRFIVCLLLIPNMVRTEKELNMVAKAIALVGWALVILSIIRVLTTGYVPGERFTLWGVNENELGTVALITTIGVFYDAIKPTHRHRNLNAIITYFFMIAVAAIVAISGSRGSAIALGLTLVGFWFFKPTRQYAKLGMFMLVIGVFAAPFVFQTTLERFMVETGDTALGGREEIWAAGWRMIWDNLWLGVGIGNAPFALKTYLVYGKTIVSDSGRSLHNPVLTIWAETGIVGVAVYMAIFFNAAWLFLKMFFRSTARGFTRSLPLMALSGSVYLGFLTSWIKGGGMESDFSYFLMLALLVLPVTLYGTLINGLEPNGVHDGDSLQAPEVRKPAGSSN